MAYIWREVPSLESTYAGDQESWNVLGVGDGKEETSEAENPPAPTLAWVLLSLLGTDLRQHQLLSTSLPPVSTLSVSYICISLVNLWSFLEQSRGRPGLAEVWISRSCPTVASVSVDLRSAFTLGFSSQSD